MAERMVRSLPREASSPVVAQLQCPFRTEQVKDKARSDFGETVGAALDMVCNVPLIEVYINNRKAGTFSPDVQNAQKVLPTLADCTND